MTWAPDGVVLVLGEMMAPALVLQLLPLRQGSQLINGIAVLGAEVKKN